MFAVTILAVTIAACQAFQLNGTLTCYSNNCTTKFGEISSCSVLPSSLYYPMPTCTVPAATGTCFSLDWPATSSRTFGCFTHRSCPFGYNCCSNGDRCNCDPNFSTVKCELSLGPIQVYPHEPFTVSVQNTGINRMYIFEVWTNYTGIQKNVTFSIQSVSTDPSVPSSLKKRNLFGIERGQSINSARVFIDANTDIESFMAVTNSKPKKTTYTLRISAQAAGIAEAASNTFKVNLVPVGNHVPVLTKPTNYGKLLSVNEDDELQKLLVKVCARDDDKNLDAYAMCQSLYYESFYFFNDPSQKFMIKYNETCKTVQFKNYTGPLKTEFCANVYTKAGAIFDIRQGASMFHFQLTFKDKADPPAELTAMFNVTVVPRESSFWRYCFVCNASTCPLNGIGESQRCLPGQHYCCKRLLMRGSRLYYSADRFCSNTRMDNSMSQVSCCAHDYCNSAPLQLHFTYMALVFITILLIFSTKQT